MKTLALLLIVFLASLSSLSAQRGGGYNDNSYNNNNNNNGQQFSSMLNLNTGENNGGIRPNGNVNNNHSNNNNNGHNHNNNHYGNQGNHHGNGHHCSHGSSCSFGCNHNHYVQTPVCMSAFDGWLHGLSHQNNEAVRMNMVLNYVRNNWLTTHQIYDILGYFGNESVKLRIAEDAYAHTCDPNNFYRVYSRFSNSACVLHLQNFVVGR